MLADLIETILEAADGNEDMNAVVQAEDLRELLDRIAAVRTLRAAAREQAGLT